MRRLLRVVPFFLVFLISIQLNAQTTDTYQKKWLFGMNWGGAWENADVHSRLGTGWGLTLEKEIIANNTSLFGFSLRGRYLHTWMWGRESKPFYGVNNDNNLNGSANPAVNYSSDGYVYRNFYTKTDEFSLEGLLILNRLRTHSGFKIYGFGGIGATGYLSKINQLDGTNSMYDYSSVSTFSKSTTKNDLNNLWDNSYETNGVAGQNRNSYVLSGAIGVGIGIKLSPNVYLGWEHKYTYTSTDNLDASKWKIDATESLKNDRYHYSSLFLTVAIGAGSSHVEHTPNQTTYYPPPAVDPKPIITLLFPKENPVYLKDCIANIKLRISNVVSVNQITVLRDGNVLSSNDYSFDAVTEELKIYTPIVGNTVFSIIAQNSSGKDTKYVYTNCSEVIQTPVPLAPIVSIISSSGNNCIANVVASVKNVSSARDIEVIMDGLVLSSQEYSFNPYNGSVILEAPFNQFTSITIRATNARNSAVQTVNLSCTPAPPIGVPETKKIPVINIISSDVNKADNGDCIAKVIVALSGVRSISMISVSRNGTLVNTKNYTFNASTGILTITYPIIGTNTFLIKVANSFGTAAASVMVECIPEKIIPPVIELVQPSTSESNSNTCKEHVALKVLEVTDIQDINVLINGVALSKSLMQFDAKFSLLTFDASITNQTVIIVSATNKGGTATKKLTINCTPVSVPTIQINVPNTDPFVSALCQEIVTATVTGVADVNSIHVTVNGIALTAGLNYNIASEKLTFPVNVSGRSEVLINAVGKGGTASKSVTIICQPAPKPVITLISPNTTPFISTSCQENVSVQVQHVESVSNISVTINGIPVANNLIKYESETGVVTFPAQFVGNVSVVIKATNANGSALQTISLQCKPIVLPKPTIKIIAPISINTISKTCREAVKVKLTNCAALTDISVLENGVPIKSELLNYSASTGILTFEVSVLSTTTIFISAKNNGGIATTSLTIQCKPTLLPSVSILDPIGSPVTSVTCAENIRAIVKNVTSINQIEVTYNGITVDKELLKYDIATAALTFLHTFKANGDLIIKASNDAGQDSKTISLVCQPVLLPELVIVSPKQEPYVSENCNDTIVAKVKNVEFIDDITAFVNNIEIAKSNILFDKSTGVIQILASYTGNTEIKLIVKNAAGSIVKSIHISCKPILQPTINLINPISEVFVSQTCEENILMNIVNIFSKDQIEVKVNTVLLNKELYTFEVSSGLLTIPIVFTEPTKVEVSATNKTKTAYKFVTLTCNKLPLPTVIITSPSTETSVVENCNVTIKATVTNVTSKEQLIITHDGKVINASTYTFGAGIVSFPIKIDDRANINITATNTTGVASDVRTIVCDEPKVVVGPSGKTCATIEKPITSCNSCNDTITVLSGDIVVNANKKVCVPNSFNGNVTMNGGQLVICGNATIRTINFNSGDIVITGNAAFDNLNMNNSTSAIRNYGTVRFSNITFNGRFENHGQATVSSDFNVNSSAVFINTGTLNATMNFNNNNFVCNSGTVIVGGNLKDNGSAEFNNSCKLNVSGQLHIDKTFINSGVVTVGSVTFVNGSGKLTLAANSKLITTDIVINGSIAGSSISCALIQIKNDTRINGSASLSGKINVCDVNGVELKTGSIGSSVTTDCSCFINSSSACSTNEDLSAQITICHMPPGNPENIQTITISKSALAVHLAHGDHVGACTDSDIPVKEKEVEVIPPVVAPPVEEEKIIICHIPPGNPENIQTITISKSALAAHLGHGDHVGACTNSDIPVKEKETEVIPPVVVPPIIEEKPIQKTDPKPTTPTESANTVVVCHTGTYGNKVTLTIPKNQLSFHLAHGDHVGACTDADNPVKETQVVKPPVVTPPTEEEKPVGNTDPKPTTPTENANTVVVCHTKADGTKVTLTIPKNQLPLHRAHGDHVGECTDAEKAIKEKETEVKPPVVTPPAEEEKPVGNTDPKPTTPAQGNNTVVICHKKADGTKVTLTIPKNQLSIHIAHGDRIGECTETNVKPPVVTPPAEEEKPVGNTDPKPTTPAQGNNTVVICHKKADGSKVTLTIPKNQLSIHIAHGDRVGECTDADKTIKKPTPKPQQTQMVTICHKKADGTKETLTVPQSQLQMHLSHGDRLGVCTPDEIIKH